MRIAPASIGFTLLLGGIAALPPLAIDMSLPALGLMGRDLAVPAAQTGLTLSLFLVGYALAQLVFGPVSDRFGRRWPLLGGTALFAASAIGVATSASIGPLLLWRCVQGAGAGAGTVLAFAIVRDLFAGSAARVKLSTLSAVLNMAPLVAPSLGSVVLGFAGWRSIYLIQGAAALILVATTLTGFAESLHQPDPGALRPRRLAGNYLRALRSQVCLGYSVLGGMSFGAMFAYVAGSPFVFIPLLGPRLYGAMFAGTALGLTVGALLSGYLARRGLGVRRVMLLGLVLAFVCHLALLGLALGGQFTVADSLPLLIMGMVAIGFVMPNAVHGAMEPFPDMAGVASALRGSVQMVGGAVSSAMVGALYGGTPVAMSLVMALFSGGALLIWGGMLRPATRIPTSIVERA